MPLHRSEATDPCAWTLDTWRDPIDLGDLVFAASKYGEAMSSVKVGEEFSDTALLAHEDISDYASFISHARPGYRAAA